METHTHTTSIVSVYVALEHHYLIADSNLRAYFETTIVMALEHQTVNGMDDDLEKLSFNQTDFVFTQTNHI